VLESILRDHLADPAAVVTLCEGAPFDHHGTNDSTAFFKVRLAWASPRRSGGPGRATWIVKRWRAGGERDRAAGIVQPREVLAWERGLLRPGTQPEGVVVPFVGARRSADGAEAWLAMAEVSTELGAYPRLGLTGDQALGRVRQILARLASFHAWWERADRQVRLAAHPWLGRPGPHLGATAPVYARALGRAVATNPPAEGEPASEEMKADLIAYLEARPADERGLWESLLIDRRGLFDALASYPPTLLHNDLDDRNIGLRWPTGSSADAAELVLIDWEWLALGPAAIDAAKVVHMLPVTMQPGTAMPPSIWTDDLADHYFGHYRAAGGLCVEPGAWRRSFWLARIAHYLSELPHVHGRLLRTARGEVPLPRLVGIPAEAAQGILSEHLRHMTQLGDLLRDQARRWLP
jgi:hypothetical protein